MEKFVEGKLVMIKESTISRASDRNQCESISKSTGRIKSPCIDGGSMFKFQFEPIAYRNGWDDGRNAFELVLALKSAAAKILEIMSASCSKHYHLIMALQDKFGDGNELYRMEIKFNAQKANESLRAFAMKVESKQVQLKYPEKKNPLVDNFKNEAFVSGIRDTHIKLVGCSTQKTIFVGTVAFRDFRSQVSKVQNMEVVEEKKNLNKLWRKMNKRPN